VSGFPVEHHDIPETPVQHTIDSSGRKVVTIGTLSPGESEQPTLPIPISSPMRPAYDPLRLLSPLEKDCPRLISADEQAVRTFIAAYKEYRRAEGVLCAYTINDLISIKVRQIFRMSSVQDPYSLITDEEWISFLLLRLPKLETLPAFAQHFSKILMKKESNSPGHYKALKANFEEDNRIIFFH
jgi:hypothetical protein